MKVKAVSGIMLTLLLTFTLSTSTSMCQSNLVEGWVPYVPFSHVDLKFWVTKGNWYMDVSITFPDSGFMIPDWGTVMREGCEIWVISEIWDWTGWSFQVITKMSHTYELGRLEEGNYTFTFMARDHLWDVRVKSINFTVVGVVEPTTWTVDDDGPADFHTIQEAINAASPGDTILVSSGTYYENVVVNKPMSLVGEDRDRTIIDGSSTGTVMNITANYVNVTGFTIRNSMYTAWYSGVKVEMDNCNITNNIITNNWFGVYLGYSPGQYPRVSSNNMFCGNNITNNRVGVYLSGCANSTIAGNNITNSYCGVFILSGSGNQIYHNNFIGNFQQVGLPEVMSIQTFSILPSVWKMCGDLCCVSYPSGGNYWSDYNGTDLLSGSYQNETGSDSIGDTAYTNYYSLPDNYPHPTLVIIDSYPLMGPISFFNAGTWNNVAYSVNVASNSTVSDFFFNPYEGAFIRFNVSGPEGTTGFCRVVIPKELLWVEDEQWTILVGGEPVEYVVIPDENCTYICFTYSHTTKTVEIIGTNVVPEFPTWTPMLLILILLSIAIAITKRRLLKTPIH